MSGFIYTLYVWFSNRWENFKINLHVYLYNVRIFHNIKSFHFLIKAEYIKHKKFIKQQEKSINYQTQFF